MAAARDYIKIDRTAATAIHAAKLLNYIRTVRNAWELSKEIQGIMDHNNDGTNFADLEVSFGLPTGSGATVLALVAGSIADANAKNLTERVG